jgi:hypothetical protein
VSGWDVDPELMAAAVAMERWTKRASGRLASSPGVLDSPPRDLTPVIAKSTGASSSSPASSSNPVADSAPPSPVSEPELDEEPRYTRQEKGKGRGFDPPSLDNEELSDDGEPEEDPVDHGVAAELASEALVARLLEEDRAQAALDHVEVAQRAHIGVEPDMDDGAHWPSRRADSPTSADIIADAPAESADEDPSTPRAPTSVLSPEDELYVPSSQKDEWYLVRPLDAKADDRDHVPSSQADEQYLELPSHPRPRSPSPWSTSPGYSPESPTLKRKLSPVDGTPPSPKTPRLRAGTADSPRTGRLSSAMPFARYSPGSSSQMSPLASTQSILPVFMDRFSLSQSPAASSQTPAIFGDSSHPSPGRHVTGLGLDLGGADADDHDPPDAASPQSSPLPSTQSVLRSFLHSFSPSPSQSPAVLSRTQNIHDRSPYHSPGAFRANNLGLDFGVEDVMDPISDGEEDVGGWDEILSFASDVD